MRSAAFAFLLAAAAAPASAAQLSLSASNIIGSPYALGQSAGSAGFFSAANIFDHQTGAIGNETYANGYWLSNDQNPTAWITIDLGAAYAMTGFSLFNTHNGHHFDRGTGAFDIFASNEIANNGVNGFTLAGSIATLVSGTLAAGADPIGGQAFSTTDTGGYRFLQFRPRTISADHPYSPTAFGLNELRIFGEPAAVAAVPEPASWAMMVGGFGLLGAALRRGRKAQALPA